MTTPARHIEVSGGVLVAHDGSRHSTEALRVAVRHAAALGWPVTVVRAWSIVTAPRPETWERGYVPPVDDFAAATLAVLQRDVAAVVSDNPEVDVTATVVQGPPGEALIEASGRVDLVVVGSRGRGGFAGLLLGSVSDQVVRHARCPVLVTRDRDAEAPATPPAPSAAQALASDDPEQRSRLEEALASEPELD